MAAGVLHHQLSHQGTVAVPAIHHPAHVGRARLVQAVLADLALAQVDGLPAAHVHGPVRGRRGRLRRGLQPQQLQQVAWLAERRQGSDRVDAPGRRPAGAAPLWKRCIPGPEGGELSFVGDQLVQQVVVVVVVVAAGGSRAGSSPGVPSRRTCRAGRVRPVLLFIRGKVSDPDPQLVLFDP